MHKKNNAVRPQSNRSCYEVLIEATKVLNFFVRFAKYQNIRQTRYSVSPSIKHPNIINHPTIIKVHQTSIHPSPFKSSKVIPPSNSTWLRQQPS
jgi:hypothetical protein